jgi:hypothetical protein
MMMLQQKKWSLEIDCSGFRVFFILNFTPFPCKCLVSKVDGIGGGHFALEYTVRGVSKEIPHNIRGEKPTLELFRQRRLDIRCCHSFIASTFH